MKYIEVTVSEDKARIVSKIADKMEARDFRLEFVGEDGMQQMRLLVSDDRVQPTLDALQVILDSEPRARIAVLGVELFLPQPDEESRKEEDSASSAREKLYDDVEKNARLDINYLVLVFLSTTVAAIGLLKDNVAVIIGAMVIAPLLGPNLALSLGTALNDLSLMRKALSTLIAGVIFAVLLSYGIGWFWPVEYASKELMLRANAGLDSVALALASGAAAALSLTSGLASVLVGVMVAVALLPPAATIGLMLGKGHYDDAIGAVLLLSVNIICVNLSSKIVFLIKGVSPRSWQERKSARISLVFYIIGWLISLAAVLYLLCLRGTLTFC